MRIERIDNKTVEVGPLDLFCCELLRQIRISAEPGDNEAVRARLFPSPTSGCEPEIDEDWREYVQPELATDFGANLDVITEDLANFPSDVPPDDGYTLHLPVAHLEAWIHGLNQARLAIAARYNFTEAEMNGRLIIDGDSRSLALFQEHFYGLLLECFVRILDGRDPYGETSSTDSVE